MTRDTHIIALTGYAGAGKDTVADLLVAHAGFTKLAFADALRAEVALAYGVPLEVFIDRAIKETPRPSLALRDAPAAFVGALLFAGVLPCSQSANYQAALEAPRSPRQVLQWWGTEYRRKQDEGHWRSALAARINYRARHLDDRHFVITDCRFENEADMVRNHGGAIWQVRRPGIDATTSSEGAHASANDGSSFRPDQVIDNSGDIHQLRRQVMERFWALSAGLQRVRVQEIEL